MAHYKVKEIAEAQGFDKAKLSRRADLNPATVAAIWDNQTTGAKLETLQKIAEVLGVEVRDLITQD